MPPSRRYVNPSRDADVMQVEQFADFRVEVHRSALVGKWGDYRDRLSRGHTEDAT